MNKYTFRHIARITLEAMSPIAVGTGEKDVVTDALVAKDVNGLPYIPGTGIAGVIRHALGYAPDSENNFFGFQNGNANHGSEIIFSEARLVGEDGKVIDGMAPHVSDNDFLKKYKSLPIRQHVCINHRGSAADTGKFDEQVVYKGSRFCFDIEALSDSADCTEFDKVLDTLYSSYFCLGGGTRKGFGSLKVVPSLCKRISLDLSDPEDWEKYKSYSSALDSDFEGQKCVSPLLKAPESTVYILELEPDDFFLFSSGYGDEDADILPVKEDYISWETGFGVFHENGVLIPATSIKGALAHRIAFYWNKEKHKFADQLQNLNDYAGEDNPAVKELFGSAGQGKNSDGISRGKVIICDIFDVPVVDGHDKLLNHVSIDRFTGGAIDGALFSERSTFGKGRKFQTKLVVLGEISGGAKEALKSALTDICSGMLPLGGGTGRGNGVFTGKLWENDKLIYPHENV